MWQLSTGRGEHEPTLQTGQADPAIDEALRVRLERECHVIVARAPLSTELDIAPDR
jgi:hypothetical protein